MYLRADGRIKWIDIAKAFAMILIVIGHTSNAGLAHKVVYAFHVPVFFFLSGVTSKSNFSLKAIGKDIKRIMIPYYVFGLISIFAYAVLGAFAASKLNVEAKTALLPNICELFYGSCRGSALQFNRPLWFLPSLFATKQLSYLLDRVFRKKQVCLFLVALIGSVLSFWYTDNNLFPLPFSFELSLKLFPFFLIGKVCASHLISLGDRLARRPMFIVLGGILFVITCVLGGISPSVNYTSNTFPSSALFYCVAFLGCISMYFISATICSNCALEYFGKESLSVLVMHKFPIVLFQTIGPFEKMLINPQSAKSFFFAILPVTTVAVLLCLGAGYVIGRYIPCVLGKTKKTFGSNASPANLMIF